MHNWISLFRLWAIFRKEFIQMRRDRLTFAMMVGVPIIQLALFGFAINMDPKQLPMAINDLDRSQMTRSIVSSLVNTGYFKIVSVVESEQQAEQLLDNGQVQFVLEFPSDFTQRLVRGEQPSLLLLADATDPAATSNAIAAIQRITTQALPHDLKGALNHLSASSTPYTIILHRMYNPEGITQYNIVPGLMGVILTMTMIMMTSLAITRENERGTMENLLSMPSQAIEVMIGKIIPYIFVGYIQVAVILLAAYFVFSIPILGSLSLLLTCVLIFIFANLTVGITFSSIARTQAQAMQMTFFFFLPSILLSGFMFPFRGMPHWAQAIGEVLPLTHFLRIVRGVMLKGNDVMQTWPHIWPLGIFIVVVLSFGLFKFRKTLD